MGLAKFINKKIDQILEIKSLKDQGFFLSENVNQNYEREKYKDSIIKKLSNFVSSINNAEIFDAFDFETKKIDLDSWISQYGLVSIEAIKLLKENNEIITDESISKTVDKIINENANKEIIEQNRKKHEKLIDEIFQGESKIKFSLKKLNNSLISHVELVDFNTFLNAKQYAYKKMLHLEVILLNGLKKIRNYYLDPNNKYEKRLNENNELEFIYHFKNNLNETFDLKITEDLHMDYKIGDYKDHCCEQTSEKLWQYLKNNNISIISKNIIRQFANAKPLYKSISKIHKKEIK
ncbi:hypothetical protein [Mycoplasma elephantis]|uniref:hypothetical protein n=1 Tax=Mycoplasma elephantis TaxID=114882 RepID=UPI000482E6A7|nr:hypothetical protein [Mycoplasma elephantis]